MKSKRLIVTLVLVFAFIFALAISSYAATITLYSGADATTSSTTHNGSLTLTGNTEENETVTVYFTDDGRAWKAGENVSFKEDTNLYTIECTKISTVAEYKAATGGGNYILMSDIDLTKSGGSIVGENCTTRIFMNGKKFNIANSSTTMVKGNCHSVYLLGEGYISSAWGGGVFIGALSNTKADVKWLIGRDITIETNKDAGAVFYVYNGISIKSLNIHIYGTIIKAQSGNVGAWSLLSIYSKNEGTDYNIYFYEGSSVELVGYIVRCGSDGSTEGNGNIIFDGGDVTLSSANYFYYTPSATPFVGTVTVNAGTFTIANADSMTAFKNAIVSDKKAEGIDATSFKVICKECAFEKTLGDDFVGLDADFTINNYCPNCKTVGSSITVERVFDAKGYSVNPNGTAINGGYSVNHTSLALYEEIMGNINYGIVIANANSFDGNSFFNESNAVNSTKAIQVDMENEYSNFDCSISGFGANASTLELIITAYVIDKDGCVTYIQSENDYAIEITIGNDTFTKITLELVKANIPTASMDAIIPSNDEE